MAPFLEIRYTPTHCRSIESYWLLSYWACGHDDRLVQMQDELSGAQSLTVEEKGGEKSEENPAEIQFI